MASSSKDAYWFHHDANARHDPKLVQLKLKHGMAAVGIWWNVVEMLRESDGYALPDNDATVGTVAYEGMTTPDVARDILSYCVELGLLVLSDGEYRSESLVRRMERWDASKSRRSEHAAKAASARWDNTAECSSNARAMPEHNTSMPEQCPSMPTDARRGEERRGEKSINTAAENGSRSEEPVDNPVDNSEAPPDPFDDLPDPEPDAEPEPEKPPSEHQQLVDAAMTLHKQATGSVYAFSGEDGKHLQQVRKKLGFDEAMTRLRRYYTGEHWFTADGAYSLRAFHRHVNELAANGARASPTPEQRRAARDAVRARRMSFEEAQA